MVYIVDIGGVKYYACSVCGLLYESLSYANECEEFCKLNPGKCSIEIAKQSIGYVDLSREVQKVFFKIDPSKKCGRPVFKLCKTDVNIYTTC